MKRFLNQAPVMLFIIFTGFFSSCNKSNNVSDAYGNFEAEEIIVSAQAQGEITYFNVTEGKQVVQGALLGRIDSVPSAIKKSQVEAQQNVIKARLANIDAQLKVQEEQRINLAREVERSEKLLADKAVTQQQYDDINGRLKVLNSQTDAIYTQKNIIMGEQSVLKTQIDEANNMLSRTRIISPVSGTIIEKYADQGELVTPGKALFKVANLDEMELKVFISGSQLSAVAIGDSVDIMLDAPENLRKLRGVVSWISSQVEFTPKIIQTKEERINMVYAVKVRVKNDGYLKIGMPGEVLFNTPAE